MNFIVFRKYHANIFETMLSECVYIIRDIRCIIYIFLFRRVSLSCVIFMNFIVFRKYHANIFETMLSECVYIIRDIRCIIYIF